MQGSPIHENGAAAITADRTGIIEGGGEISRERNVIGPDRDVPHRRGVVAPARVQRGVATNLQRQCAGRGFPIPESKV